jgi:hypothetical protein
VVGERSYQELVRAAAELPPQEHLQLAERVIDVPAIRQAASHALTLSTHDGQWRKGKGRGRSTHSWRVSFQAGVGPGTERVLALATSEAAST